MPTSPSLPRPLRFQKYNDSLRGFGPTLASCKGNTYVTTIHAINSMVVKASKLTKVGRVYRGVSGGVLPDSFWTANKYGVRGGVERSFISTTYDRAEAMRYASADDKPSVVFELQMGMIDRGCDLAWISQYKGERECLFPPLTGFELEHTRIEGRVLVVGIRLSVNLKAQTLEQVVTKMKRSHLGLVQLFLDDLKNCHVPDRFCRPLLDHKAHQMERAGPWFSDTTNFQLATAEAFAAHDAVFDELKKHDETWSGAVRAANMCAREGRQDVAIALLSKAKLGVEAVLHDKTRVASWIVNCQRLAPPWLETLAALNDPGLAQLITPQLLQQDVLVPGTKVLAWEGDLGCWMEAIVERVRLNGSRFDVRARAGKPMPDLARNQVITVGIAGVGALVRAASETGHAQLVRALIARGASVWVADELSNLPLHCAAAAGHVDVCRELLRAGADEMVQNAAGQSAVLLARSKGRCTVNRLFVRALSDSEFTDEACADATAGGPITPLMVACHMRDRSRAEEALGRGGDVNAQSATGCTALYLAAEEGDDRMVEQLLAHGANVAISASDGSTPLLRACEFHHEACVQLLLEAGALVNQSALSGLTPLIAASQHGHHVCAHVLIEAGAGLEVADEAGWTALMHACLNGHDQCVVELLEAGASTEAAAVDGSTALMLACTSGHVWIVRALIEAGASLERKNEGQSTTALMQACAAGQLECVNALLQAGADANAEQEEGWTALRFACRYKHQECAKALVMAGCDVNHPNHSGSTVLMAACRSGQDRCVYGLMMLSGAHGNATDNKGWTPLMHACDNGHTSVVAMLIDAKVNLEVQSLAGDTALMLAFKNGHDACVRLLVGAGAHLLAPNHNVVPALSAARKLGDDSKCCAIMEAGAAQGQKKKKKSVSRCIIM
jgi:ankyrin repeat protein